MMHLSVRWRIDLMVVSLLICCNLSGQSDTGCQVNNGPLSNRQANYTMDIELLPASKAVRGVEQITWVNISPDTLDSVHLYMYMNAFQNNKSSFLRGAGFRFFGEDLSQRPPEEWGWIRVSRITQHDHVLSSQYIQPDDGNEWDETVLQVQLEKYILPGDTLSLVIDFETKLPKTMVRSGYSRNEFFHIVHWYPKMGVYEIGEDGEWGWNCHQFLRQMEFYGDFGVYNVRITADRRFKIGSSGCLVEEITHPEGQITRVIRAEDVIDFAWCAYPDFRIYRDNWNHVEIELLSPPHHRHLVPRIFEAVKISFEYLSKHVGEYPYQKITVMDPPAHGLRSGFMEYPTYITGGSFVGFPTGLRSMESLIVHEFSHQYFMAMLANNEKEEAWLDEGFVTYYEDCIMEERYGTGESLIDLLGYRVGNWELTRNEFTSMINKRVSAITTPSYLIRERYKGIIYSKTALMLRTLRGLIGEDIFLELMRGYFQENRFSHPSKEDFVSAVERVVGQNFNSSQYEQIMHFLKQALDETAICDFAAGPIFNELEDAGSGWFDGKYRKGTETGRYHSSVRIHRLEDLVVPVEIVFRFSDGTSETDRWDGREQSKLYDFNRSAFLEHVEIDPERKIVLDVDYNNNSYTVKPRKAGLIKYSARAIFWLQNIFQSISFLM